MCKSICLYLLPSLLIGWISWDQENSPKSHAPVKISLVVGFLLLCLTWGQGASSGVSGFISPAQVHRAPKSGCSENKPSQPKQRQGRRQGLVTLLLSLPLLKSCIQRKCIVYWVKGICLLNFANWEEWMHQDLAVILRSSSRFRKQLRDAPFHTASAEDWVQTGEPRLLQEEDLLLVDQGASGFHIKWTVTRQKTVAW